MELQLIVLPGPRSGAGTTSRTSGPKTYGLGTVQYLNPIEELWAIVQQDIDKQKPATNLTQLQVQLQQAWSKIKPSVLSGLVASMPVRVRTCLRVRGEYIEH